MSQVFELMLTSSERIVLLALADFARDDGSRVFPSISRISWKTDLSKRQTQRIIKKLREKGLLIPMSSMKGGRGFATEYRINITAGEMKPPFVKKGDTIESSLNDEKGRHFEPLKDDISSQKDDISSQKDDKIMSSQPSERNITESSIGKHYTKPKKPCIAPKSIHSFETILEFVLNKKRLGHKIDYPQRYAESLFQSAKADSQISNFLEFGNERQSKKSNGSVAMALLEKYEQQKN